ncbi:MAG: IS66 family transposase, partial [Chthoniobacterales bacterium]
QSPTTSVPGCANCLRLERELQELREEVAELRRQLNRNSGNSSTPPSANPPWAPRPARRKPSGRKPGGQPGHEGHHRELLPVEQVDEVVKHRPAQCRHCGARFTDAMAGELIDRHQVSELPKRAVKITEHQAMACTCGRCGQITRQEIPKELTRSVLGERLSAAIGFVSCRVHGSRRAVEDLLEEVLGAPLALGTVMAREREITQALSEPYRQAREMIQKASAKNVDETGWKRAGRFLWVAATRSLAVFHLDPCRNRDAMHALLGQKIKGTICTDRFGVYEKVPMRRRGLCWSHLKRDFQDLSEQKGAAGKIGDAGLDVCTQIFDLWHQFRERQISRAVMGRRMMPVRQTMNRLLKRGMRSRAKRAAGFCGELLRLEPALWTFTRVEGIEPTNNHAERMLRPAVMWRKQSLGSHSSGGCRFVERMMTVMQTLRLRGQSMMDYLEQAIQALRCGVSPPPLPV